MDYIRWMQLLFVFILCLWCSYTDCLKGKIFNIVLFPFGIIGLAANLAFCYFDYSVDWKDYVFNILIIFVIGSGFYFSHIWAGGDVKFLFVLALLYPISDYFELSGQKMTLAMFLIPTFGFGFFYIVVDSFVQILGRNNGWQRDRFVKSISGMLKSYVITMIYIVAWAQIYHFYIYPVYVIPGPVYLVLCFAISMGIHRVAFTKDRYVLVALIIFDGLMAVFTSFVPLSKDVKYYALLFAFMVMRSMALQYNYQQILTCNVKRGMIISRYDTMIMSQSRVKGLPGISDETLASRISDTEAESIKRWEHSKTGRSSITIVRKVPFAIFISLGVFVYLIMEGFWR